MGRPTEQDLSSLRAWVTSRYEASSQDRDVVDVLARHNDDVLGYVDAIARAQRLDADQHLILRTTAVLHDVAKAEVPLLLHATAGAVLARDKLTELGIDEGFIRTVERAILCHMGPLPFIAEEVRKYAERTGEKLQIPQPQTRLERLFYDADMLTLMEVDGVEKVVLLRTTTPQFIEEDRLTAEADGTTPRAAAYASALRSVHRAASTLFSETARGLARDLIAEAERHVEEQTPVNARTGA